MLGLREGEDKSSEEDFEVFAILSETADFWEAIVQLPLSWRDKVPLWCMVGVRPKKALV